MTVPLMQSTRFALIGTAVLVAAWALAASTWGTPDFAIERPPETALRPVEDGEWFRVAHVRVKPSTSAGFSCFHETRPRDADAWNPPVTVLWLVKGDVAVRFSSHGCRGSEVLVDGSRRRGSLFTVDPEGRVSVDPDAGAQMLLRPISDPSD